VGKRLADVSAQWQFLSNVAFKASTKSATFSGVLSSTFWILQNAKHKNAKRAFHHWFVINCL
jgi:hypothetical protein